MIFENPGDHASPYRSEITIPRGTKQIYPQSPDIPAFKNDAIYEVTVLLYSDAARSKLVGEHHQGVRFQLDPELAQRVGVDLL